MQTTPHDRLWILQGGPKSEPYPFHGGFSDIIIIHEQEYAIVFIAIMLH